MAVLSKCFPYYFMSALPVLLLQIPLLRFIHIIFSFHLYSLRAIY